MRAFVCVQSKRYVTVSNCIHTAVCTFVDVIADCICWLGGLGY
jgi:hypothetical protein